MSVVVLAKVVPKSETLRYDATHRRVVREGSELVLNPFDQRALGVALAVRRPGETVTVVSMSPPAACGVLAQARAAGADRVVVVLGPEFVGSDTLATSRALAAAIRRLGPALVLAGARSTDSDTAQVGPEVAALLGVPVANEARAVHRDPTGATLEVTVDTPQGWATVRLESPAVVTVGEKVGKPAKPPVDATPVSEEAVERWSLLDLGLPADRVGSAGSPTTVREVRDDAPVRAPQLFRDEPVEVRVRRAVDALESRLAGPGPSSVPWAPPPAAPVEDDEVLVLVTGRDASLDPAALDLIAEVRRIGSGLWPSVLWVGAPPTEAATFRLARAGALLGRSVTTTEAHPDGHVVAEALELALGSVPRAAAVLALSDPFGREVAASVAAHRGLGLVGDVIGLAMAPSGRRLVWTKPSFGGRTVADIDVRGRPALATVRPGAFAPPPDDAGDGGFGWRALGPVRTANRLRTLAEGSERSEGSADLARREVLVAVGMGVGGPDAVASLGPVLTRLGAGLVATRRVVDAGWVPRQQQLGLTGRSYAPRLAVLLGVSGSANHMIGWRRARAVLAVNRDPDAPVFRDVDVGIVGRIDEVLPRLAEELGRRLALGRG